MDKREDEFLKRLQSLFGIEAEEHLSALSSGLIELENKPSSKRTSKLIETIFRETHSLKGAARSVNRIDIESICQELESIFSLVKNEKNSLSSEQFDLTHKAIDVITNMVSEKEVNTANDYNDLKKQLQSITKSYQLKNKVPEQKTKTSEKTIPEAPPDNNISSAKELLLEKKPSEETASDTVSSSKKFPKTSIVKDKLSQFETVRIPTAKLDSLFLQAEQLIQSKITTTQRLTELKDINNFIGLWKLESKKRDITHSGKSGLKLKEIVDQNNKRLTELEEYINAITSSLKSDQRLHGRLIDEHLESMKKILMLPISSITEGFPRLVRSLARSQNKEAELIINGKEIAVDKQILEDIKDPLIHLIRNCIDHGIEKPKERLKTKKTSHGTIRLTFIAVDGRNLEIIVSDNGSGINTDKVIATAINTGILSKDNARKQSNQEIYPLIFDSGITTSPMITDISGRGLGLAIVKEKVEKLGGTISVESFQSKGTTFRLFLPLTLSTFRGVLVRTGEHLFFMPSANVKRTFKANIEDIKTVENRETIAFDNEIIALVKFSNVLGLNGKFNKSFSQKGKIRSNSDFVHIAVLKSGEKQIGFIVDEILDEHQILVKELGKQLKRVHNISGASVLGSGRVVPVINVSDLMKSAVKESSVKVTIDKEKPPEKVYKILVTEDSITSRTLIKDILEIAGYVVETAVDGIDGYTKTLIGEFDLIVSDVDMPRMNGFEFTNKIRNTEKLCELPVVLVTALESREDREHGIDVGANAYIIKSSFDQSNLLDVIKKLL